MKKLLMIAAVAVVMSGVASAIDPCNTCAPAPCVKPIEKWITVTETVMCEVPVTEYIEEPCEITVTKMVPCVEEVECTIGKWIFENKTVCYQKQVIECEEYTVMEKRTEMRSETRSRKVCRVVPETVMKTVWEDACEEVCDVCTGRIKAVHTKVKREIPVTVQRKVWEDECYTVQVPCTIEVPVTKTRKVCRTVPAEKVVRSPKFVQVPTTKKVTVMRPTQETKTVLKKRAVCTTKMVEKQVQKRVKVIDPCTPIC